MKYDTQHIDQYLKGELSEPEIKAFEQQMQSDKDFAYEVKLQETAIETVQYANFMTKVEGVRQEIAGDTTRPKENASQPSGVRWLRPLLGLAVAAMIALLIWQPWQGSLVDRYYTPIALDITQMSDGEQELQQAQEAYNSGDYTEALPIFEKYPNNTKVQLAKGNAEYNLKKIDAAVATFQKIASGNSEDKYAANWYLALTYLKQGQPEKAKIALGEIKSGKYYDDAQKLLKKVK